MISRRRPQPRTSRLRPGRPLLFLGVWCALLIASCSRGPTASGVSVTWKAGPGPLVVGTPIVAEMTIRDPAGQSIRGATLAIEGHMSHPGMAPVLAEAQERADGVYQVRFQFPMAGDWIVLVKGSLPDGRTVNQRIDVEGVQPSG